jgi:hypothetical protein
MDGTFIARAHSVERGARVTHWATLGAILLIAIAMRVVAIDAQGLWTDEALTIVLSNWSIPDMLLLPTDPTPALYYILHKLLIPADAPLILIRSISMVAGVVSVGLIYLLGRLAFGPSAGLLAAALLAVWAPHVDYSQEARAYSLLFLLTLLASFGLLCYARLLRQEDGAGRRRLALALFCAGSLLSFYTHVIAAFWIALTSLLLLAIVRRERRIHWPELLASFASMAIGAAPGLLRLTRQVAVGDQFHWLPQASLLEFADTDASVFLPVGLWHNPLIHRLAAGGMIEVAVAAASLALLGAGCWIGRRRLQGLFRAQPVVLWIVLAYLAVPVLVWLTGFVARPLFMERTILLAVPGMILLIAAICRAQEPRLAARAAIAVVVLYGSSTLAFGIVREKEDWRGAYDYLAAVAEPGDVIAVCPLYNYPALRYHASFPAGSAVIGVAEDGRLLEIERGLGSDPAWDKTYFRYLVAADRARARAGRPMVFLNLRPGQSIWRVDGHCNSGFSSDMGAVLAAITPDPGIAWSQVRSDPRTNGIKVRRYRIVTPLAIGVLDLTPDAEKTPPIRSTAGVP